MSEKFIPNRDDKFRTMATAFAGTITDDPARFAVSQDDAEALSRAVERFDDALHKARCGGARSPQATRAKNEARKEAEAIIRRLANAIRANDDLNAQTKFALNLRVRPSRPKAKKVPQEPPLLWFVRARHEADAPAPLHELRFRAADRSRPKPAGAVRLELFVDLVPPEEPIPAYPGANLMSRPWYLRSFTRSPIVLAPPMTRMPMRVVYWGRWADSTGNVGPFSKTAVAWVEGGSHHIALPHVGGGPQPTVVPMVERPKALEAGQGADGAEGAAAAAGQVRRALPDRSPECRVMLLEAQRCSYQMHIMPMPEGEKVDTSTRQHVDRGPARQVMEDERRFLDAA